MEFLLSIKSYIFATGPFFLVIGVLIFIHELGHFLAARYFGVRVEVFSLGFGPKILKKKYGDTVYCISAIPFGGYVKMYGGNPLEEIPEDQKKYGFLSQKPLPKWIIAFGGPFMNIILAVAIFFALTLGYGIKRLPSELGDIKKNTEAYSLGFRSGDTIKQVNGKKISYYKDFYKILRKSPNKTLNFQVLNEGQKIKTIKVNVNEKDNPSPWEWKKRVGVIEGLSPISLASKVGVIKGSLADQAGLETFDKIEKVNGQEVRYWRDLEKMIPSLKSTQLEVKRGEEKKTITLVGGNLKSLGIMSSDLYVEKVAPGTPAEKIGLKSKDRLVFLDGKKLTDFQDLKKIVSSKEEFEITYERGSKLISTMIKPKLTFQQGDAKSKAKIGVMSAGENTTPPQLTERKSLLSSLGHSVNLVTGYLNLTVASLWKMIKGEFSFRNMSGAVSIGRVAHQSYQRGFQEFMTLIALVSIALFFFNVLPIPVLDGGYLLFFAIEGILRRPISPKKLVFFQSLGLALLLPLMVAVNLVDIYNWVTDWW